MKSGTRRHERKVQVVSFAYCRCPGPQEVLFAVTSNISALGMCIYTDAKLEKGQCIEFRSSLPVPFLRATVEWVRKDVHDLYRIGLTFIA